MYDLLDKLNSTYLLHSGFGGLEVACWPLVHKFAVSNRRIFQAEKILSTPSFRREVKPFVPRRIFAACKRTHKCMQWKSQLSVEITGHFSPK